MNNYLNRTALGLVASFALMSQSALAQEAPISEVNPAELAQQIADRAAELGLSVENIGASLANLPADLEGVEQVFDEMIMSVENVLAGLDDESDVGQGILGLLEYTKASRARWSDRCASTNNTRDCTRVDLWEEKVREAVSSEADLVAVRRMARASLEDIRSNREYVIDDIKLGMVEAALETLNGAIENLGSIVTDMTDLAGEVDPDREVN